MKSLTHNWVSPELSQGVDPMLELYLASSCELAVAPKAPKLPKSAPGHSSIARVVPASTTASPRQTTATAASALTSAEVIRSAVLHALAAAQITPLHLGVTLSLHVAPTGVLPAESDIIQIGFQDSQALDLRAGIQAFEELLATTKTHPSGDHAPPPNLIRAGFGSHPMLRSRSSPPPIAGGCAGLQPLMHGHTRLCAFNDTLRVTPPALLLQLDWIIESDLAAPTDLVQKPQFRDLPEHLTLAVQVALRYSLLRLRQHRSDLLLRLAPPQRPVLPLLAEGLSQRQIADRLSRSLHTVHDHVKGAYAALGISARHQLFVLWNGGNLSDMGDIE